MRGRAPVAASSARAQGDADAAPGPGLPRQARGWAGQPAQPFGGREEVVEARKALVGLLEGADLIAESAADGASALRLFYATRPNAVVLGLDLPELDGWEVLGRMRELSETPVLILAERENEVGKVRGLRAGADDYMTKPFGRAEIVARVEAMLRRTPDTQGSELFADDFLRIDHRSHEVDVLGKEVELTPIEFRMLATFARHAGQAPTHSQLLRMVWGEGERDRREVKLYVSYLRRKLSRLGLEPVETVRGIGYRYRPRRLREARNPP